MRLTILQFCLSQLQMIRTDSSDEPSVCPYFKQQAFFIELMKDEGEDLRKDEGEDFRKDVDALMSRILIYPAAKLRMPPRKEEGRSNQAQRAHERSSKHSPPLSGTAPPPKKCASSETSTACG